MRDRALVAVLEVPIGAIMNWDMRHLWHPRTWIWLNKLRGRLSKDTVPFEPFVFFDDGTVCEKCEESVPVGSLLPCRCVREAQEAEPSSMHLGNEIIYALHGMDPASAKPCEPACDDEYCAGCAMAECPLGEPLHRHHDGCPAMCNEVLS